MRLPDLKKWLEADAFFTEHFSKISFPPKSDIELICEQAAFFRNNFESPMFTFFIDNYDFFLFLTDAASHTFVILNVLQNADHLFLDSSYSEHISDNLENIASIYHYSVPNTKLAYPEPFIASASFMHSDLWFVHILVYQYWLWFVFVFLIIFFFLTFVCTLRWCNMRIRPRRETRGVSRSKCGDLITATVPVTWATSIIVNESTDAIDYYDGFGTTELVVGIRAYQWGWEYYYPKDIDLNYNIRPTYSAFIGNSLKYNHGADAMVRNNNLWKFYQNKTTDQVVTPAHILAIPFDNFRLLNFLNFNDIGSSPLQEMNAFKKIKMFSKAYSNNLVYVPSSYSAKYRFYANLYLNDASFTDSYLYGIKRQHNFLSSQSLLNNQATFFSTQSINKVINYNFKNNAFLADKSTNFYNNLFFKKTNFSSLNSSSLFFNLFSQKKIHNTGIFFLNNFLTYIDFLSTINDNTDKKMLSYPLFKLFNAKIKNNEFTNLNVINQTNDLNDFTILSKNTKLANSFFNNSISYKIFTPSSTNQSIAGKDRFIKNFANSKPSVLNLNHSSNLNSLVTTLSSSNPALALNNYKFFNLSRTNWSDLDTSVRFYNSRVFLEYPYSPIPANNPAVSIINYDNLADTTVEDVPLLLQGKDEIIPSIISSIYWNFYWSNSSVDWRLKNSLSYFKINKFFYLPMFTFYYDYDFRNWQSLELLEDSFWESVYSIYTHDEYLNIRKDFYDYNYFDKFVDIYNSFDREMEFKDKILYEPFFKDNNVLNQNYPNTLYIDDFISPANLLATKDFFIFPLYSLSNLIDETYESIKYSNYLANLNKKVFLNSSANNPSPLSYSFVMDMFRSDYDEFSWFIDENNFNILFYNSFKNIDWSKLHDVTFFSFDELSDINLDSTKNLRFSNVINLRVPTKNSMVTYNAIQKVFRTRFDEGRSNAKLNEVANSYIKEPFVSAPRIQYEKLLGKTKENFFDVVFYKNSFNPYFTNFYDISTSLNFYFFDFPFLLALKSDASRYLWFDWFSKWGFYEVQPSSSSRYAIYGMPYFSKTFEFSAPVNDSLTESETYLLRLSRARRNYLPNWIYTPYFYAKHNVWYKNNIFYNTLTEVDNPIFATQKFLNDMSWYWQSLYFINNHSFQFLPSNSGVASYSKLNWKPQSSVQSYYYTISTLVDILTKREYMYREFFSNNNKIISLPFYLTNSPANPLLNDVKASFMFVDPIIYNNEYSRDVYYNSLSFFNFNVVKSIIASTGSSINLSLFTDYLFYYFFNFNPNSILSANSDLFKNQYRPMKKGITNMIRLHATGAIAMPIEIRLQILASSKDVIHSWAIPSAGIKIDCVPGYSSHKVMIFLVSGIFWGQCMEICGRYHHWMPIIVYFMKRDLFFLWCTHFVFLSGSNNMWNINDRQFTDYARTVSFDKYSWISEINA